ncbi:MAG TPA: ATP-binding protein [Aggregatilineales bacterium]|nr:ATP-binding protein [Aggregatilineales bacterium]
MSDEKTSDVCPICGGLGIVGKDVPVGHPDFGKAFPCVCQAETIKARRAARFRKLGHLDGYADKTFATFQVDYDLLDAESGYLREACAPMVGGRRLDVEQREQVNLAAKIALRYAMQPEGWLLFKGTYGSGKTHLAAAIANYRLAQTEPVLFITAPDLLDHLRAAYAPNAETAYDELFEQLSTLPLVILDDVGAESPTAWAQEKLYQLFNRRHAARLPTVITTNRDPEALDPRIRSRILDYTLTQTVPLDIPDQRAMGSWRELDLTNLDRYRDMTFETFDLRHEEKLPDAEVKRLAGAVDTVRHFAEKPRGWLVINGEPGTGKTHLAGAVANECKHAAQRVLFVAATELLDYLRATFYPSSNVSFDQRLEEIKNADVLILDDLAVDGKAMSAWARDKLYDVLITRFDYDQPTVITTAQKLAEMEPRFKSRATNEAHSTIVTLTVPSYPGRKRTAAPPRRA